MATEGAGSNPPVDPGVVYILENEAFAVPVVKIGKTGQQDWVARIKQLNTAVPLPFTCAKASRVDDMGWVEAFLHQTFFPAKRQWRGEFYEVEAWRVAQVLKIFETDDVTNLVPVPDPEEEKAINTTVGNKEARADFTFAVAGIPVGTKLGFKADRRSRPKSWTTKPPCAMKAKLTLCPRWLLKSNRRITLFRESCGGPTTTKR